MKLSTRGEYATRAILELSLNYGKGLLHIRDVSEAQNIPSRFLEQILLLLKRNGYLRSKKGPNGGYYLAKPPEKINVAEVIRVMDGPLAPIDCVSVTAYESCPMEDKCSLKFLWREVRDAIADILEKTNFRDLAERSINMKKNEKFY